MKTQPSLGSQEISYRHEDKNFSCLRVLQNFVFVYAQAPLSFKNVGVFNATYSFSTTLFRLRYIQNSDGIKKLAQICSTAFMTCNSSFDFNKGNGVSCKKLK